MTVLSTIQWLIDKVILGYVFSNIFFFILLLFYREYRSRTERHLDVSNKIILSVLLLNVLFLIYKIILCRQWHVSLVEDGSNQIPEYFLSDSSFFIIYSFFFGFIYHALLLKKTFRIKVVPTIISMIMLVFLLQQQKIIFLAMPFSMDYLPSSWSHYIDYKAIAWTALFSMVHFGVCWVSSPKLQ